MRLTPDDVARPARGPRAVAACRRWRVDVAHVVDAPRVGGDAVAGLRAPGSRGRHARALVQRSGAGTRAAAGERGRVDPSVSGTTNWRRRCARGPAAAEVGRVTSSPMTSRTTAGPVRNMLAGLGHDHEVGQRRRVGAAAAEVPLTTEICGISPDMATSPRRSARSREPRGPPQARARRLDERDDGRAGAAGSRSTRTIVSGCSPSEPPANDGSWA